MKAKKKTVKKDKPRVTKKSIIIGILNSGGGTVEQMAQAISAAGLGGDREQNLKIVKLWLPKIGFKVKRDANKDFWTKQ